MSGSDIDIAEFDKFFRRRDQGLEKLAAGYLKYVKRLAANGLPPIFDLGHLARLIGVETRSLAAVANNPGGNYRTFSIPKRRGGERQISTPSPLLLHCQRWILNNILNAIEPSEHAKGFVKGRSVIQHAEVHRDGEYLLTVDLKDFFPSIGIRRGISVFLRAGYSPSVSFILANMCFLNNTLPQGAPTSPQLSNIVAKRLDVRLSGLAKTANVAYSRYADDLAFSGSSPVNGILPLVRQIVLSEGFFINDDKIRHMGPGSSKIITGISVSRGILKLPRSSVRAIKQESHFLITRGAIAHAEASGNWDPILTDRLVGRVGFWLQIDPDNVTANRIMKRLTT